MRWYSVALFFSDGRIRFLIGFIVVAIVVAVALIFTEILLRRRKSHRVRRAMEDAPIHKLRDFLVGEKSAMEKVGFLDRTAKEYFKKIYGTPINSGYSVLIEKFEKEKKMDEAEFCREMFESYYSNHELTDKKARELGNLFIRIFNGKRRAEEISEIPSVFDKIAGFFKRKVRGVGVRNYERAMKKQERRIRKNIQKEKKRVLKDEKKMSESAAKVNMVRDNAEKKRAREGEDKKISKGKILGKKEVDDWVDRVIEKGYSRRKVLDLLNDGNRSLREINRILDVFEKKAGKRDESEDSDLEGGIASRIVREEKERLGKEGFFVF